MMDFPDLDVMLRGLDQARVSDFVRHVGRRRDEDKKLDLLPFGMVWPLVLGSYCELIARQDVADDV